jgi:hypothetical protein
LGCRISGLSARLFAPVKRGRSVSPSTHKSMMEDVLKFTSLTDGNVWVYAKDQTGHHVSIFIKPSLLFQLLQPVIGECKKSLECYEKTKNKKA